MTPEQIDRLINLLITLGGKAATEGFAIALRRVTYLAVVNLAWALFVTILCGVSLYLAQVCWRQHIQAKEGASYYGNDWGFGCWLIRALSVVLWTVAALSLVQSGFDKLMNPEWHAVQMLLGLL